MSPLILVKLKHNPQINSLHKISPPSTVKTITPYIGAGGSSYERYFSYYSCSPYLLHYISSNACITTPARRANGRPFLEHCSKSRVATPYQDHPVYSLIDHIQYVTRFINGTTTLQFIGSYNIKDV